MDRVIEACNLMFGPLKKAKSRRLMDTKSTQTWREVEQENHVAKGEVCSGLTRLDTHTKAACL